MSCIVKLMSLLVKILVTEKGFIGWRAGTDLDPVVVRARQVMKPRGELSRR
jgi:hypothetical protein